MREGKVLRKISGENIMMPESAVTPSVREENAQEAKGTVTPAYAGRRKSYSDNIRGQGNKVCSTNMAEIYTHVR